MGKIILSFLALILLPAYMSGQVIKGKVLDKSGIGIPGAIVVTATSSVDTDFEGNFNIKANAGEILKITMLGFDPVSVKATEAPMTIKLVESQDTALKEVVVIGYGTRKKVDNTTGYSGSN